MKKIRFAVTSVIVIVSIIVALCFVHVAKRDNIFESGSTNITGSVDEYIKSQPKVKAEKKSDALWLKEDYDVVFDTENEDFIKTVKNLKKLYFDTVFLSADIYENKESTKNNSENIDSVIGYLKNEGLKVFLRVGDFFSEEAIGKIAEKADGVIIFSENENIEKLNGTLLKIKAAVLLKNSKAKVYAEISPDTDMTKFNKRSVHGVYMNVESGTDSELLKKQNDTLYVSGTRLILNYDIDSVMRKKTPSNSVLKKMYETRELDSVSVRSLSSYKAVKANYDNSFSSLRQYIEKGINPDMAFREIGITGFDGKVKEISDFTGEIEIYGSDLYPAYINGEKISLGETGSRKLSLSFKEGLNEYKITQCGKTVDYKVNVTFEGDILKSVTPENEISLYPKETATVTVVGYYKAKIFVKVGTREYRAKAADKSATGYAVFTAKIKMPSSPEEVESLGMITVIGTYKGKSMQLKGGSIALAKEQINNGQNGKTEEKTTVPVKVENYVPSLAEDVTQNVVTQSPTLPPIVTAPVDTPTVNTSPTGGTYTGNEMALIAANYADTRPLIYNDDTYYPSYSALVKGTMDYITAESEAYSKELGKQVYFYELSSGVKVQREDVELIAKQNLPDNSVSVLSSSCEGGTLKIYMSTSWKVPYTINFTPQSYFSQYGTRFNLTSFNASYISVTFHHTASASGTVNTSGSDIAAGASWDISPSDKTATLYMPLRATGQYYGCSIEYDSNGFMVITVHNKPQTLSGSVILLDPGHGGSDPGALGYGGAVEECDVNLAIAYYTMQALQKRGATVYSTRAGDSTLGIEERKAITRSLKPDFFVSIHSNGSEDKNSIGTSVYYYKPFSKKLAENIYGEMLSVFKGILYSGQANLYDSLSDGTPYYPFSVTRLDECPSVLIETGYVTNDSECYKLIQPSYQQYLGEAIAKGIEKTITG